MCMPPTYSPPEPLIEPLCLRVTATDRERLDAVAEQLDRPVSYIVRLGLRHVLAEHEEAGTR